MDRIRTMNLGTNKELTILIFLLIIKLLLFFCSFFTFMPMAWPEIAAFDRNSKMEHSYCFCGAPCLGWFFSSSYATVYLNTFYHVDLSCILFLIMLNGFWALTILVKGLCLSFFFVLDVRFRIILVLSLLLLLLLLLSFSLFFY